jgi:hypothetical protein
MRVRARFSHEIPQRPPIRLAAGEAVLVGEPDLRWPAFVYVRADHREGWVPRRHLSGDEGSATVVVPYDTTELAVAEGDVVIVVERDDESGWWWCRADDGREGWVPLAVFDDRRASTGDG